MHNKTLTGCIDTDQHLFSMIFETYSQERLKKCISYNHNYFQYFLSHHDYNLIKEIRYLFQISTTIKATIIHFLNTIVLNKKYCLPIFVINNKINYQLSFVFHKKQSERNNTYELNKNAYNVLFFNLYDNFYIFNKIFNDIIFCNYITIIDCIDIINFATNNNYLNLCYLVIDIITTKYKLIEILQLLFKYCTFEIFCYCLKTNKIDYCEQIGSMIRASLFYEDNKFLNLLFNNFKNSLNINSIFSYAIIYSDTNTLHHLYDLTNENIVALKSAYNSIECDLYEFGRLQILKLLWTLGVDITCNKSILIYAIQSYRLDIVCFFIESGYSPWRGNNGIWETLFKSNNYKAIRYFCLYCPNELDNKYMFFVKNMLHTNINRIENEITNYYNHQNNCTCKNQLSYNYYDCYNDKYGEKRNDIYEYCRFKTLKYSEILNGYNQGLILLKSSIQILSSKID